MSHLLSSFTDGNSVRRFTSFNFTIYCFGQDSQDMDTVAYKSSPKFTPELTTHYQILIFYFYSKVNTKAEIKHPYCVLYRLLLSIWYRMHVVWCWHKCVDTAYTEKAAHSLLISLVSLDKVLNELSILTYNWNHKHSLQQSTINNQICFDENSFLFKFFYYFFVINISKIY